MGTSSNTDTNSANRLGIADALFSRVRQRVLGLLFGRPDQSFYANEIIGWVGAGTGAVQRELARLQAAGLVTVTRIGRQKHYQANRNAPIYDELRGIVLKTSGLRDVLREALAPPEHSIRAAYVFGSVARGLAAAGSDVDLMVISDQLTYGDLFTSLEAAASRLSRPVNPTIYSWDDFRRRIHEQSPFVTKTLAQPRIWIIGSDDDLAA
jgi:predicted nucleotidyltransferase